MIEVAGVLGAVQAMAVLAVLAMLGPSGLRVAPRRCARCELRSQPGQLLCAAAVRRGHARAWGAGDGSEAP